MEKFNIYEYVAVIVPGVVFLFGTGVMLPESNVFQAVLMPRDMGTAAVHLFLAFAVGHMLQVLGQQLHAYYWSDFGGFPTDWPFTRQHNELSPALRQVILEASGEPEVSDLFAWRRAVATIRSLVTTEGFSSRLETFHANYGMFRSLVVAGILLLFLLPWCTLNLWSMGALIAAGVVVALLGMHRFGVHYARELFAAARAWQQSQAAWKAKEHADERPPEPRRPQTLRIVPRPARGYKKAA